MRITFKKQEAAGRYKSFFGPASHNIKIDGLSVGLIEAAAEQFQVRLKVKKDNILADQNPNCEWWWVTMKLRHTTVQSAKDWFTRNYALLAEKYKLHMEN